MKVTTKTLAPCLVALLAFAASSPNQAFAQNPYTIDGVVPANGTTTGPAETTDPFGNTRELGPVNSNETKVGVIHAAVPPMLSFTNPNGQVDLRRIWTQTTKAADGDIWFYFAWERDANTGSGFIAYEFQQSALSPSCVYTGAGIDMVLPQSAEETALINSCNPWQNRQPGDFLILWDQSGGALTITKRVFMLSGGVLVLGPNQPLGTAVVAISADGFRGEAAVNLSVDVFPQDGSCVSFANIIPGTVTGNSDTADYKDTVFAPFAPITNCGIVTVTKHIDPTNDTGSFPYTLARSDGSAIRFDGTTQINQTLTHHGDSTGSPITNLIAGDNYTLVEAPQTSPWELVSIICTAGGVSVNLTNGGTFTVDPTTQTDCVITNRKLRGSIQVIKNVVNDNGGTAVPGDFTLTLGDSANTIFPGASGNGTVFTFDAGYAFNVGEIGGPEGYVLTSKTGTCSGAIIAGTTQVCTLTNDDQPAQPAGATIQRAVLHDSLVITGVRTGSPGAAATVTFRLYADAACSALVGTEGPVGISLSGSTGTATTVSGILVTQSATTVYYWTAQYSGDQFNSPFTTACGSEKTTIVFEQ
ncbi:MAG TPA: hypothetical protein VJ691_01380 [Vicinamibacterales bacterium]|nr:hypothetical protein [Vicinamibacterales bacterium]